MAVRPIKDVLATGTLTGLVAGFAAGMIDAVWSWKPAAQFVPGAGARLRFVLYTAFSHGTAGVVIGVLTAATLLVLARGTRLGDLTRFAWAKHAELRVADPRDAVAGLSLVLAGLPVVGAALWIAYRVTVPLVTNRHVIAFEVIVAMAAALVALGFAAVATFVVARPVELALRRLAPKLPIIASPFAPLVALGALLAIACALWAWREWATARVLPLRGPLVAIVALILAIPAQGPARRTLGLLARVPRWPRRAIWVALAPLLALLVLWTGGSASVIKAATAYTGLGAPIARELRRVFDRDHDGYARYLGGRDCDDSDPSVHPGAVDLPGDGKNSNCVGGDAQPIPHTLDDVAFTPVPGAVPANANILMITIDTTRADHLHAYGYKRETSPNLDALARDGTLFRNAWAHAPSTRYSMPAILTGRLPLDVYYDTSMWWPGIALKANTLAEQLQALGFATGAITNYEYFDPKRHMNQGFAEYDNEDARLHVGSKPDESKGSSSQQQSDKAIAFVDRHAQDRWFLWVHYYDPHYVYEAHPDVQSFGTDDVALYDQEIAYTDKHIGRLLQDLKDKGLYDKTIVVVTGDHGEGFGEHGINFHGYDLYAAQTKVPLIVRVPGLTPRDAQTPAGHVDILPTLVNLAGGQATLEMMGRSLVDVLAGGKDFDRVIPQQLSYEGNHEKRGGASQRCHVLYNVTPDTSWEVYRVDRDPMETQDVFDEGECAEPRKEFERWYDASQIPEGATDAIVKERPQVGHPVDADLGAGVQLIGVDAPARAKPGEQITLTWVFKAREKIAGNWKVFAHFVDGPKFVNADHDPVVPFAQWQPDQFIRYTTKATLSAPGSYKLECGLWDGKQRAKPDAVVATTIEVAP